MTISSGIREQDCLTLRMDHESSSKLTAARATKDARTLKREGEKNLLS
jgi:hypothetical protein